MGGLRRCAGLVSGERVKGFGGGGPADERCTREQFHGSDFVLGFATD
jgi:hypothetical protein